MTNNKPSEESGGYKYSRPNRVCPECLRNYNLIIRLHRGKTCPNCGLVYSENPLRGR